MSNTIRCHRCNEPTHRGTAHIRSRVFEQVGWCDPCWQVLYPQPQAQDAWLLRIVRHILGRAA